MKITSKLRRRGLTLIEMTLAMSLGMTIAVMMLAMVVRRQVGGKTGTAVAGARSRAARP